MYEFPINIIQDMYSDLQIKFEDEVLKAVTNIGINVDKEELIKALEYDRGQYDKGVHDAYKMYEEKFDKIKGLIDKYHKRADDAYDNGTYLTCCDIINDLDEIFYTD